MRTDLLTEEMLSDAIQAVIDLQLSEQDYLDTGTAFAPARLRQRIRGLRKLESQLVKVLNKKFYSETN